MFSVNQTIKVNNESFQITKIVDAGTEFEMLVGTREGDPKFLAGKRSIAVFDLKANKNGTFKYSW